MKASTLGARLARSTAAHVAFAFLAMGGWAVFANRGHPPAEALVAGLAQGCVSGLITLSMKKALEAMAARLHGPPALIVPPLTTMAAILGVLVVVHRLAGTPELWATIAVPYAVSSAYAWIYAASLRRRG
ncbi:MAG: hypothetical protein ABW042_07090 [Phenylobacterium sp.]